MFSVGLHKISYISFKMKKVSLLLFILIEIFSYTVIFDISYADDMSKGILGRDNGIIVAEVEMTKDTKYLDDKNKDGNSTQ